MVQYEDWQVTISEGVAELFLNRPDCLNAQRQQTFRELGRIMDALQVDSTVHCVMLYSGGRAFSAGADIKEYAQFGDDVEKFAAFQRLGLSTYQRLSQGSLPVVAAVHGLALGGGSELAFHCDVIVAAEEAYFGLPEVKLGLIPGGAAVINLLEAGYFRAVQALLTGENISARQMAEWGIVSSVTSSDKVHETARSLARSIAQLPPLAVKATKKLFANYRKQNSEITRQENELLLELFKTEDAREAIRAFKEKRKPIFRGR